MIIVNETDRIVVVDARTGEEFSGDGGEILEQLTASDVDAWLRHTSESTRTPGCYPLVAGLAAIPPATAWRVDGGSYAFVEDLAEPGPPLTNGGDVSDFIRAFGEAVAPYRERQIGVELSGGLDTSLVIELLVANGVEPTLIGFSSRQYEFRTERRVQEVYAGRFKQVVLIPYEGCEAFADLDEIPRHSFPTNSTHFFARHRMMAEHAVGMGVEVLFSGDAGDQLFGAPVEGFRIGRSRPVGCYYWNLAELWSHQYIYLPRGLQYISALALPPVVAGGLSLRGSGRADPQKWFPRRAFSQFLPEMLSKYAYCAFHDGWVCAGLHANADKLGDLAGIAFKRVNHPEVEPSSIRGRALSHGSLAGVERRRFLLASAFVVWVASLEQDL